MKKEQGFTLIELIIVIVIVGILAAVALPRFIDAQRDARISKAHAVLGSIRSAAALARARCELDLSRGANGAGTCGNAAPAVNMDGIAVTVVNRHPTADANGIERAAQLDLASDGLLASGGGPGPGATRTWDIGGGTVPNCRIAYTAATVDAAGNIVAPVIAAPVTSGC